MTGGFSVVSLDCQRVDFRCESAFQASQAWMTLCVSWCRISFGDCDKGSCSVGHALDLSRGMWADIQDLFYIVLWIMQTVHLAAGINISCWLSVLQSGFTHARGHIDHATSIKLRIAHYSCIGWTIFSPEINIARTNKNQQLVHLCDYNVMPCSTSLSTSLERLAFGRPCATETSAFSGDQCNEHWENQQK